MADINANDLQSEIKFGTTSKQLNSQYTSQTQAYDDEVKRNIERTKRQSENGGGYATIKAKADTFLKSNLVSMTKEAIDKLSTMSGMKDDPNYSFDPVDTYNKLNNMQLPVTDENIDILNKAKSREQHDYLLEKIKETTKKESDAHTLLTDSQLGFYETTGALSDPFLVGSFGLGAIEKGISLTRLATYEGAFSTADAWSRYAVDEKMSLDDAITYGLVNFVAGTAVGNMFRGKELTKENIKGKIGYAEQHDQDLINQEFARNIVSDATIADKAVLDEHRFFTDYGYTKAEADALKSEYNSGLHTKDEELHSELNALEEENRYISEYGVDGRMTDELSNKIDTNNERIRAIKEEQYSINDKQDLFNKVDDWKAKESIQEQYDYIRNLKLAEQFKDPIYEDYKINRRLFFAKQSDELAKTELDRFNIFRDERASKIESLKKELEVHKQKLAKADTPRKEAYRQKKIDDIKNSMSSLSKEIVDAKQALIRIPEATDKEKILLKNIDDMSKDIAVAKQMSMDFVKNASKEDIKEYMSLFEEMSKRDSEFKEIYDIAKSKTNNKEFIKKLLTVDKKKGLVLGAAAMFVGTNAMASDGTEGNGLGDILSTAVLIFAGLWAMPELRRQIMLKTESTNLKQAIGRIPDLFQQSLDKNAVRNATGVDKIETFKNMLSDGMRSELFSSLAIFYNAGGKSKEFIDKMLTSENGAGAEVRKFDWTRNTMSNYVKAEKEAFSMYKKEMGYDDAMTNFLNKSQMLKQFSEEITDAVEGIHPNPSPSIKMMVETFETIKAHQMLVNQEYKTLGFVDRELADGTIREGVKAVKGMVYRLYDFNSIKNVFINADDIAKQDIRNAVVNTLMKPMSNGNVRTAKEAEKEADKLINSWTKVNPRSSTNALGIFNSIKGLLRDNVTEEEFLSLTAKEKEKISRAMHRIDFNYKDFNEEISKVSMVIDGIKQNLSGNMFIKRNMRDIVDESSNTMYGQASLSKAGFKSYTDAMRWINENIETDISLKERHKLVKQSKQIVDLVVGKRLETDSELLQHFSAIAKDLTVFTKMHFAALSTLAELAQTIGTHGVFKTVTSMVNAMKFKYGADSELFHQMTSFGGSGMGSGVSMLSAHKHGFSSDIFDMQDADAISSARKGTMLMRDATLYASGLPLADDLIKLSNMEQNINRLEKLFSGKEHNIPLNRFEKYGIDDEAISMFSSEDFKMNNKGTVKKLDRDNWSQTKRDKFDDMLFSMGQDISPQDMIGNMPLFAKTSSLGRFITSLVSYGFVVYNEQAISGVKNFDRMFMVQTVGSIAGSFLSLQARYAIEDKKVDEEKLMMYALMNHPIMSGLGGATSMYDPATVKALMQINQDFVDIANSAVGE